MPVATTQYPSILQFKNMSLMASEIPTLRNLWSLIINEVKIQAFAHN